MTHQRQHPQQQPVPADGQQQKPPLAPAPTMKKYDMYYTTSRMNVKLHLGSSSGPCAYYVHSVLLSKQPQLQLRAGNSKHGPMVAFARAHYTSRHMTIGSGDYEKDADVDLSWEELRREQNVLRRGDYEFATSVEAGPRRTYRWRRDRGQLMKTVYECVDESGRVVAEMLSGGMYNFSKGGEIKVVEGLGKKVEELFIVSALAIWVFEAGWSVRQGYSSKGAEAGGRSSDNDVVQ